MSSAYPILTKIDHDGPVLDSRFVHALKLGLLLALREQELLTDLQLRLALERLGGTA